MKQAAGCHKHLVMIPVLHSLCHTKLIGKQNKNSQNDFSICSYFVKVKFPAHLSPRKKFFFVHFVYLYNTHMFTLDVDSWTLVGGFRCASS